MIVRISGVGQYELDDSGVHKLHELDTLLTDAIHSGREEECGGKAATEPRGCDGHGDTSAFVSLPGSWETFDRDVAITLRVPRAIITTVRYAESAYSAAVSFPQGSVPILR